MLLTLFKRLFFVSAAGLILAGCAVQSLQPGMARDEVLKRMGTPSNTVALASGTRLQYSLQPMGRSALMVDLDQQGRVTSVRQVLTPNEFALIVTGQWTRSDVEREFGRPAFISHVANWQGDIMTYRWHDGVHDMFFWVYLDPKNVAQQVGQGIEFRDSDRGWDK